MVIVLFIDLVKVYHQSVASSGRVRTERQQRKIYTARCPMTGNSSLRLALHCTREGKSVVTTVASAIDSYGRWAVFVFGPGIRDRVPHSKHELGNR